MTGPRLLAYAMIFGASQQTFTRLIDRQAQTSSTTFRQPTATRQKTNEHAVSNHIQEFLRDDAARRRRANDISESLRRMALASALSESYSMIDRANLLAVLQQMHSSAARLKSEYAEPKVCKAADDVCHGPSKEGRGRSDWLCAAMAHGTPQIN